MFLRLFQPANSSRFESYAPFSPLHQPLSRLRKKEAEFNNAELGTLEFDKYMILYVLRTDLEEAIETFNEKNPDHPEMELQDAHQLITTFYHILSTILDHPSNEDLKTLKTPRNTHKMKTDYAADVSIQSMITLGTIYFAGLNPWKIIAGKWVADKTSHLIREKTGLSDPTTQSMIILRDLLQATEEVKKNLDHAINAANLQEEISNLMRINL